MGTRRVVVESGGIAFLELVFFILPAQVAACA